MLVFSPNCGVPPLLRLEVIEPLELVRGVKTTFPDLEEGEPEDRLSECASVSKSIRGGVAEERGDGAIGAGEEGRGRICRMAVLWVLRLQTVMGGSVLYENAM